MVDFLIPEKNISKCKTNKTVLCSGFEFKQKIYSLRSIEDQFRIEG